MSCYRRVTAWGLGFPSLLPPTSVKPLSGRPLAPLPLTLAEVQRTGTQLHGSGCVLRGHEVGEQDGPQTPCFAVPGNSGWQLFQSKEAEIGGVGSITPERIWKF